VVSAGAKASVPTAGSIKRLLFVDFETYYDKEYSLRRLSPPEYILDPRYQTLLMAAYDLDWAAPTIIMPHEIPSFLEDYPPEETQCCSFNALFDLAILAWRYQWIPARLQDSLGMVRALRNYRRNSLKEVMKQLFGRDTKGDTIHKVIGQDAAGIKRLGLWPEFCTYAMHDVRDCTQIYLKLLPEFPMEERLVMDLVLRAAIDPTLHADVPMLEDHLQQLRRRKQILLRESGYDKATLMSTQTFKQTLESLGVPIKTKPSHTNKDVQIPQFAKSDPFMAELLEYEDGDEDTNYAVQTLAAARLSERSTIEETRAERFVNIAKLPWPDGTLLPVPLRYGGAHTHRLSGEWKMNCQNLPRDVEKSRLRAALTAPAGYRIITADLAQIEARIVACLAGETELIKSFANKVDVYASFASIVFGRPVTKELNPHERFIGKTAVLGLGYGCGWNRFYVMVTTDARKYGIPLEGLFSEEMAETVVDTYRSLFNNIKRTWFKLDSLLSRFLECRNKIQRQQWGPCWFESGRIVLPNRMTLRYTLPDEHLYGAKLLENITQALARIVVMSAAVRLYRDHSLRFVLQTHDELVFVVPEREVNKAGLLIEHEMIQPPEWMPELPLAVEVKAGTNYGNCRKI
jgi:hypothetical protein